MLYENNTHAKCFKMARERLSSEIHIPDLKLRLISDRKKDGRVYNLPTVSEVAALIVGDVGDAEKRDIIVQAQGGQLQRIDEFHASYLAYQYPLLFPYGEDGYRPNIAHRGIDQPHDSLVANKYNRLTIREWLAYRIQMRLFEGRTLLSSRRLFLEFLVDGFTMLEAERLRWLRMNQKKLRVSKYKDLNNEGEQDDTPGSSKGKRYVLPSTYVGGRRFMDQLYFDGMAICSKIGFPDIFITFTCNPRWPEIERLLAPLHQRAHDRPDIVARIFKMKFDQLMSYLIKKAILGKVLACKISLTLLLLLFHLFYNCILISVFLSF